MGLIKPVEKLAKLVEIYDQGLAKDLRRTLRQIPPVISERFSKRESQKELKRFIGIAMGSSDEMITHITEVKILQFSAVKDVTRKDLIEKYKIYLSD